MPGRRGAPLWVGRLGALAPALSAAPVAAALIGGHINGVSGDARFDPDGLDDFLPLIVGRGHPTITLAVDSGPERLFDDGGCRLPHVVELVTGNELDGRGFLEIMMSSAESPGRLAGFRVGLDEMTPSVVAESGAEAPLPTTLSASSVSLVLGPPPSSAVSSPLDRLAGQVVATLVLEPPSFDQNVISSLVKATERSRRWDNRDDTLEVLRRPVRGAFLASKRTSIRFKPYLADTQGNQATFTGRQTLTTPIRLLPDRGVRRRNSP